MRATLFGFAAFTVLGLAGPQARAADPVSELLGWVPGRTNLALFVDVEGIRNSAAAKKSKWGTANNPATGLDSLPAGTNRLVVASHFDPGAGMSWEVTVTGLQKPIADDVLFKGLGATPDKIGGKTVGLTRKHGYVTNLAPGVAASYQPPNRQDAGRWLREANGKVPATLSPYLKQAAAAVGPDAQIVVALDTTEMFDPALVKIALAKSNTLKGKEADAATLAELFGGLTGVTLTIRVTDKITGEIRLDFDRGPDALRAVSKPLLLEVLDRMGVHSEEMDKWTSGLRLNSVTFAGSLSEEGTRDLLSPFLRPSAGAIDTSTSTSPSAPDAKAQASLKYYQGVQKKMHEVWKSSNPTYPKLTTTFNNAARHIDELPILNVDDELIDWATSVGTTFRTMAIVSQSTGGTISLAEANKAMATVSTPNYYTGSVGGYASGYNGGYGFGYQYAVPSGTTSTATVNNHGAINNFQQMSKDQEALYRRNTWKSIDAATVDVRRKMTKKYGIEFESTPK